MSIAPRAILLVEDDENDVLLIQRAFRNAKLANPLHVVRDGDSAVAYLSGAGEYADRTAHPLPELMLLDLKLPRKSGLEVLAWLRQESGIKRVPVVVLTSSRERRDVDKAYELGANSYLVKPVEFESLLEMVKTLGVYWMIFNEKPDLETG
ncbi:MAG TPA: response regulator [Gemmatimonadales bacterium]|nr:response regulator [Gemmatimonadales bacterium]